MSRIAGCIAVVLDVVRVRALLTAAGCCGIIAVPQMFAQGSAKPASYSGCVQKAPDAPATLIISTPTTCARLTGKVSVDALAGRQVNLTGILTPRTSSAAASIQVNAVGSVGSSCSDVCSLQPPGTRGLHPPNSAVPGTEGGTPGVTTAPHP